MRAAQLVPHCFPRRAAAARRRALIALLVLVCVTGCRREGEESWLGPPTRVAPGIELYRTADSSLIEGAGPIAVFLLRLDPRRVRLASALSNDRVTDAETVVEIAARHRAIAAVNGGFFNRANGEPTGLLKVAGELVSDASVWKGAVVIGPDRIDFDRLSAKMMLAFEHDGQPQNVPIDGVDTTRQRGRLMLYTPAYHPDTDTAPTGTEWVVDGRPLRIVGVRQKAGRTPIPAEGAVLSFGGVVPPASLAGLVPGAAVRFDTIWKSASGLDPEVLDAADHIITGAGLLKRAGEPMTDWSSEGLTHPEFLNDRHPRTLIGRDEQGYIWLAAIDGRQPDYSLGMDFEDLQRLANRLDLRDALNLDGGGSTTMVVADQVVNRPSDPTGPRAVSDAIVVMPRP
jgi:exopolysaccharide biosynthesis protein